MRSTFRACLLSAALGSLALVAADPVKEPVWSADQRSHWSYLKPVRKPIPQVERSGWVRNPIDAFILSDIESVGLEPAPEADRRTLIRRVTFDLTGLPPLAADVEAFVNDPDPGAFEKLVDRLLASPAYGERWAKPWLDLARYAESDGFKTDAPRPNAWRFRDWVIRALDEDMPYDRFVKLQIAGDVLEPNNPDAFIATGFNRNWPFEDNNKVPGLNRELMLEDITDTSASVFLGLTLACARCHNHKYDALSQKDYFRFKAIFGSLAPRDDYALASPIETAMHHSVEAERNERDRALRKRVDAVELPYKLSLLKENLAKLPEDVRAAFETEPEARSAFQEELLAKNASKMAVEPKKLESAMSDPDRKSWSSMRKMLADLGKSGPEPLPAASGMTDFGKPAAPVHLLAKGNYALPGEVVEPGYLSVFAQPGKPRDTAKLSRQDLAVRIATADNPLTARVIVNRLWQGHFGRGIVATPSDFGTQGAAPTHPDLLDWLATELVARGWRLKAMHKLLVTSAAYRQSSIASERAIKEDPDNALFCRMNRRRLEAEAVRDELLAVAGELDRTMGGPGFLASLPPGLQPPRGGWTPSPEREQHRRAIYGFVKRNLKTPLLDVFDAPDTNVTCPERLVSVNAPQALALLNSDWVLDRARALARRVRDDRGASAAPETVIERVYALALGRPPTLDERNRAAEFLSSERNRGPATAEQPLIDFCHAIMNINEFVFID